MPTAVFYAAEGGARRAAPPPCEFGRAAVAAYVDGIDGRLMRSMKSILGSTLIEQTHRRRRRPRRALHRRRRDLPARTCSARRGGGRRADRPRRARPAGVLRRRRPRARRPGRGGAAQRRGRRAGFREIEFQYEPIAAAFDYEQARDARGAGAGRRHRRRHLRLLARPRRPATRRQVERKDDILANHGVHVAGTDFDRRVELASILPLFGYGALRRRAATARRRARCRARSTSTSRPGT